jgi:hypothetical protein
VDSRNLRNQWREFFKIPSGTDAAWESVLSTARLAKSIHPREWPSAVLLRRLASGQHDFNIHQKRIKSECNAGSPYPSTNTVFHLFLGAWREQYLFRGLEFGPRSLMCLFPSTTPARSIATAPPRFSVTTLTRDQYPKWDRLVTRSAPGTIFITRRVSTRAASSSRCSRRRAGI